MSKYRKISLVVMAVLVCVSAVSFGRSNKNKIEKRISDEQIVIDYAYQNPPVFEKDGLYDIVEVEGLDNQYHVGWPIIPVQGVRIYIPSGKTVSNISATYEQLIELPGEYYIKPASEPTVRGEVAGDPKPDPEIYSKTVPWPGKYAEQVSIQQQRGHQILILNPHCHDKPGWL